MLFFNDGRSLLLSGDAIASTAKKTQTSDRSELAIAKHSDGRAYEQEEDDGRSLLLSKGATASTAKKNANE